MRWGPRTIDVDILYYDQELVSTSDLQIPHLRMHARAFVLIPLSEIAPDVRHPILNKTAQELVSEINTPTIVRKIEKENEVEILPV
jgi:7,8-dihydro-6-hydroxymethylpterin-pyrophosphokinase